MQLILTNIFNKENEKNQKYRQNTLFKRLNVKILCC